jgi:L-2-hydroxyglutarate oxidase LhgO
MLLEAASSLGSGTTSRNSGVVHAGIYYAERSHKARMCVRGASLLYAFCNEHGVPHRRVGKWIVGSIEEEGALGALLARAHANGATNVRRASRAELTAAFADVACAIRGDVALHSPDTGIVDAVAFSHALARDAELNGATVLTHARVSAAERDGNAWKLHTSRGPISAENVVNAAGLFADDVARMFGVDSHAIVPVRGDYVRWHRAPAFSTLVYPAPGPNHGGLGVHVTIDLDGAVRLGPDVTWDVDKAHVGPPDDERALLERFADAARKLFPHVRAEDLSWESAGIRPKRGRSAEQADFYVGLDAPGLVNVVGIESPGLTAALALAEDTVTLFA